ncbi:spindle and kinetochore-associated protein 2 isoform X2 [Rhineura floridana]|nr:spindle and kinetochore-associated protein 2 isoform X2 [Rhineura floridana]
MLLLGEGAVAQWQSLASRTSQFQKAESDLDYIQAMLEFEIIKGLPNGLSQEENPLVVVQQLSVVKSRYKMLCEQLEKISAERRESMKSIRATLAKTVKLVQEIQHHTGMEISPLSEEDQLAMQHLCQAPDVTYAPAQQLHRCPSKPDYKTCFGLLLGWDETAVIRPEVLRHEQLHLQLCLTGMPHLILQSLSKYGCVNSELSKRTRKPLIPG